MTLRESDIYYALRKRVGRKVQYLHLQTCLRYDILLVNTIVWGIIHVSINLYRWTKNIDFMSNRQIFFFDFAQDALFFLN